MYNSSFESAVSKFNLPTEFDVRVVIMHTLVSRNHVEIDKNNVL